MWVIFKMESHKIVHDKGMYFWLFILPILFTVLFISIFTSETLGVDKKEVITSIVPGYTVMFVFFVMISMGFSFLQDRDHGMVARLASTPLHPSHYLLGKWAAYFLVVGIQMIVLLLFGKSVYNIPIEQPCLLLVLAALLSLCASGMGPALSMVIPTHNMGIAITQIIALGGAAVSGLWIPFDMMPSFLQKVGTLTPQYWAHESLQAAMNGTLEGSTFFTSAIILLGFSIACFIIAGGCYPRFLKRAKN